MSDKIKFKFPENRSSWNNYFTTLEEKIELSEDDELLINREWITRKIKAKAFKWERWEKWEVWEKWERWLTWLQGEKWERWEPFRYSDFTQEQLESLKVKWDKWEPWEKWDPWKNFEYSDFTSEQLEGLRWPEWRPWRDWTWAWDMLAVNNLSDLNNIVVARKNLEVFSKYETGRKIENEVPKILENYSYQKIQDIRWNNYLPQSEIFKEKNTHFWFTNWASIGLPWEWYDVITSNWWTYGYHSWHPLKQLALWPDWVFFRKQNWENSWGKWVQVVNQYWSVEIPWNNWEYWWGETLQFFKNIEKNMLWKIGWRSDYNNWLLFEFLNWWDLRQPFWLKPTWEIWQKYYTEAWDGRIFKMWSRFALSWTHHWVGWHEYQITWWDLSSNPEVAGKHKDGWWWLFFGASDMRYLQMKSWNINIWNNNLNIFLWNKLFIQNLPISPAWLSSWQIRRDGNNIKIVP